MASPSPIRPARAIPCVRCQADLPDGGGMLFCPACGAPQLRVSEDEIAAAAAALAGANVPRSPDMRLIQWPAAIYVSLICGVASGILCSLLVGELHFLLVLWTLTCAIAGVGLYSRRFPRAGMSIGIGARIGLLCGLFSAGVSTLLSSLVLVAQRFLFGQGHEIDSSMDEMVRQASATSAQFAPPGQANPFLEMLKRPEGHSILLVILMIMLFGFTVLLALFGGIAGGHYFSLKRKVASAA
jgi:hypothetical protein